MIAFTNWDVSSPQLSTFLVVIFHVHCTFFVFLQTHISTVSSFLTSAFRDHTPQRGPNNLLVQFSTQVPWSQRAKDIIDHSELSPVVLFCYSNYVTLILGDEALSPKPCVHWTHALHGGFMEVRYFSAFCKRVARLASDAREQGVVLSCSSILPLIRFEGDRLKSCWPTTARANSCMRTLDDCCYFSIKSTKRTKSD